MSSVLDDIDKIKGTQKPLKSYQTIYIHEAKLTELEKQNIKLTKISKRINNSYEVYI